MLEFKDHSDFTRVKVHDWDEEFLLDGLDNEIRSVFLPDELIVPDDVRRGELSLEESVLEHGWPDLDSARGRAFFLMNDKSNSDIRDVYIKDRSSLQQRVLFTNASPGDKDCAFQIVSYLSTLFSKSFPESQLNSQCL